MSGVHVTFPIPAIEQKVPSAVWTFSLPESGL
jgi:hypothetical protein